MRLPTRAPPYASIPQANLSRQVMHDCDDNYDDDDDDDDDDDNDDWIICTGDGWYDI